MRWRRPNLAARSKNRIKDILIRYLSKTPADRFAARLTVPGWGQKKTRANPGRVGRRFNQKIVGPGGVTMGAAVNSHSILATVHPTPSGSDKRSSLSFYLRHGANQIMEPVHLFALVSSQRDWLSTRQSLVAQNIANIDTPGYRALDVAPFAQVLDKTGFEMAASSTGHLRMTPGDASTRSTLTSRGAAR